MIILKEEVLILWIKNRIFIREKYIFRSDIMYHRDETNSELMTVKEASALAMYEQAILEELEGHINEACSLYRKAFKLDPSLEIKALNK